MTASPSRRPARRIAAALLLLVGAVAGPLAAAAPAAAQVAQPQARAARPDPARPPAQQPRPAFPAAVTPGFPNEPAAGLCQCISDRARRNMHCLAGAGACQSVCGSTNYSLVPDAAFTCPLAPGEQLAREPATPEQPGARPLSPRALTQ